MLTRLIYYSQSTDELNMDGIKQILKKSSSNNLELSISGSLYFNENFFLQILEGGRAEVSQLYTKISQDSRHKNIVLVDVSAIASRSFSNWEMLYLNETNLNKNDILKYTSKLPMNLDKMTSESILEFVLNAKSKRQKPEQSSS